MTSVRVLVERLDRAQRAHRAPSFAVAVLRKYGDDRGSSLAALLTYYGFLTIFPLLLLLTTILGYVLGKDDQLTARVLNSAVADLPIIGTQLTQSIHSLKGSPVAVTAGLAALAWGVLGVTHAAQHAMAEVWNIPVIDRPAFLERLRRGVMLLAVIGASVAVTTGVAALVVVAGASVPARFAGIVLALLVNVALAIGAFRATTPNQVPTPWLVPGAAVAGIVWSALQLVGGVIVGRYLRHASELYGYFGSVLGLLVWLSIGARVAVVSAEVNVVRARGLWPRSLAAPPRTPADQRVLTDLATETTRAPDQEITVTLAEEPAPVT